MSIFLATLLDYFLFSNCTSNLLLLFLSLKSNSKKIFFTFPYPFYNLKIQTYNTYLLLVDLLFGKLCFLPICEGGLGSLKLTCLFKYIYYLHSMNILLVHPKCIGPLKKFTFFQKVLFYNLFMNGSYLTYKQSYS